MRSKSAAVCNSPGCTNSALEVGGLLEVEEPAFVLEELLLVLVAAPPPGLEELALPPGELPVDGVPGLLEEVGPFVDEALPEAPNPAAAPEP
jgi:hypothetical protein